MIRCDRLQESATVPEEALHFKLERVEHGETCEP